MQFLKLLANLRNLLSRRKANLRTSSPSFALPASETPVTIPPATALLAAAYRKSGPDRSAYGYLDAPGYLVVIHKQRRDVVAAIRTTDNQLIVNKDLYYAEDKAIAAVLSGEVGNGGPVESDHFALDEEEGAVYVGNAALDYWAEVRPSKDNLN